MRDMFICMLSWGRSHHKWPGVNRWTWAASLWSPDPRCMLMNRVNVCVYGVCVWQWAEMQMSVVAPARVSMCVTKRNCDKAWKRRHAHKRLITHPPPAPGIRQKINALPQNHWSQLRQETISFNTATHHWHKHRTVPRPYMSDFQVVETQVSQLSLCVWLFFLT